MRGRPPFPPPPVPRFGLPRTDPFVVAMFAVVLLAALAPAVGASSGPLHLGEITAVGVALIFFLNGAGLSPANLRSGAANWRLHALVQLSTYGLFPAIGALTGIVAGGVVPHDLLAGLFFVCALSSTVSTSIAMTTMARGNVAGAIFNATLSTLLGMALTPLLMNLWLHSSGQHLPLADQFLKIAKQLLLPFAAGQALRPWIGGWIARNKNVTGKVDRVVILLIVYNSFCDSSQAGLWTDYGVATLLQTFVLTAALLAIVLTATTLASRKLGFSKEDEIAAVFCGSKKSLATGIPMAKLLFGASPMLGPIVLPLMFYHQLQLVVCTVIAKRYADRPEAS